VRNRASQFNVITRSRLFVDVHFEDPRSLGNLLQECVIEIPDSHPSPAISLEWNKSAAPEVTRSNLIYFCTITREFSSSNSRFSIADNPNVVYRIVANSRLKGNVDIAGPPPAPARSTRSAEATTPRLPHREK
jgi:hypothetical protein